MEEIKKALGEKGVPVEILEGEPGNEHLILNVNLGSEQDFTYQIWPVRSTMPSFAMRTQSSKADYYRLEVHLRQGSLGYDLMGYSRRQLIEDVLDHYEHHMHFLHLQRENGGVKAACPTRARHRRPDARPGDPGRSIHVAVASIRCRHEENMARFPRQQLYIHGAYVDASSNQTFESINPANGEVLAEVAEAGAADWTRGESAEQGQRIWAALTGIERARRRSAARAQRRAGVLETLDTGKPLSETRSVDIVTGADVLEYYAAGPGHRG